MKLKRRYVILGSLLLVFVVAFIVATLSLERIAKRFVVSVLASKNLDGRFESLDIGLLRGVFGVGVFDLKTNDGQPLLTSDRFQVNVSLLSLFGKAISIDGIVVEGLSLHAQIDEQGKINWLNLLETAEPQEKTTKDDSSEPRSFQLKSVSLRNIVLNVSDLREDAPLKSVTVALGSLHCNMARGKLALKDLKVESSSPQPFIGVDSIDVAGHFTLSSDSPIRVDSLSLSGVQGRNRLKDNGKFVVQQWAEEIATLNGFLTDTPEESKSEKQKKPADLPEHIQFTNVDYGLVYPGKDKQDLVERIQIESLSLALKDGTCDAAGVKWTQSLEVGEPVLHLGSLSLAAQLLDSPLIIQGVSLSDLSCTLRKGVDSPFDLQNRMLALQQAFPQDAQKKEEASSSQDDPLAINGPVELKSVRLRVVVQEAQKVHADQLIELDSMVFDPTKRSLGLNGLALSDDKGNIGNPSLQISSIEMKGNLHFPLPDEWHFEQITVNSPSLNLAYFSDGRIDLIERMNLLTRTAPESQTQTSAKKDEPGLNLQLKKLDFNDFAFSLLHQVNANNVVAYKMHQGQMNLTDFALPEGGSGTTRIVFKGAFVQPSSGNVDLSAEMPQRSFMDDFAATFSMNLSDITPLRPYYEESLPFELQSGGFALQTEGACQNRNLDFPFESTLVAAETTAKKTAKIPVLGQLKNESFPILMQTLKNEQGNIVYKGKIYGTLDKPVYFNWEAMGDFLASALVGNLGKLPDLGDALDASKSLLDGTMTTVEDTTRGALEQAGKAGESIRGILPFGRRKE